MEKPTIDYEINRIKSKTLNDADGYRKYQLDNFRYFNIFSEEKFKKILDKWVLINELSKIKTRSE